MVRRGGVACAEDQGTTATDGGDAVSELDRTTRDAGVHELAKCWHLKALTDIWTGDAERKGDRLIPTGLLGSIRWWFEVVVRGLGGSACDPSQHQCPDHQKKPHEAGHHCVVCELFGCTGWGRKFRFDVLDEDGRTKTTKIVKCQDFKLRFRPLRLIEQEEWALLDLTLRLIATYGAIGGKTVYKPSDEDGRAHEPHHKDFGLAELTTSAYCGKINRRQLDAYVQAEHWRKPDQKDFQWASLEHFWCVRERYLCRNAGDASTFNFVLGRNEDKSIKKRKGKRVVRWSDLLQRPDDDVSKWLAGTRQQSKKVFSFKDPPRTFGFVKPGLIDFAAMRQRLEKAGLNLSDDSKGLALLDRLLGDGGGATK